MKKIFIFFGILCILFFILFIPLFYKNNKKPQSGVKNRSYPLAITAMRQKSYSGSAITSESVLTPSLNYKRYLVSYLSGGLKIYGLLTIPALLKPSGGWPVILFNHGYIPPIQFQIDKSYSVIIDPLASHLQFPHFHLILYLLFRQTPYLE